MQNDYVLTLNHSLGNHLCLSPLNHEDHPELNDTPLCGPDDMAKFQSLLGACQWMVSLCHMDLAHAVMLLSQFCHCPHTGHIHHLQGIFSYIHKFPQGAIQFCIGIPNHESTFREHPPKYDWMESVYRSPVEEIPHDAPEPKGNLVWTTTYKDANSIHNLVMGRSATGIIHFFNQTLVDCSSKHQNQVELATYGSEFMAACQVVE